MTVGLATEHQVRAGINHTPPRRFEHHVGESAGRCADVCDPGNVDPELVQRVRCLTAPADVRRAPAPRTARAGRVRPAAITRSPARTSPAMIIAAPWCATRSALRTSSISAHGTPADDIR
jgi:hypothetical protein